MLLPFLAKSQESLLSKEIYFAKSEALALGFELVQEDTVETDFNTHLVIPADVLLNGNIFYWVLFTDKCSSCNIQMNYWNSNSSKHYALKATISESDSIQRLEYTFEKKDDIDITLEAFVEHNEKTILYSILCKKKVLE